MDVFDLSDDEVFADAAFEELFAQAVSQSKTPSRPPRQIAPLEELDDSLLDHESFSQALATSNGQLAALNPLQQLTATTSERLETSGLIAPTPVDLARANRERPPAVKFKPWTNIPQVGEDEFGHPDFEDPEVIAALGDAEKNVIPPTFKPVQEPAIEIIQITRAELEAIKQNAFLAGQANYHRLWKRRYIFDILMLPAELRLAIYAYALQDTNPATAETQKLDALPIRTQIVDCSSGYVISETSDWPALEKKPWINLSLLRTCKQIYREARDDVLYRNLNFEARVPLNAQFHHVMKQAPKLAFWQHMQHLHLVLHPVDHMKQTRGHVTRGIEGLIALLRGGKKLKSFHLSWEFTQLDEKIEMFRDLQISGSIVVTQHYDDANVKDGQDKGIEREKQIRMVMLSMQGLRPNDKTEYDVITSQTSDRNGAHAVRSQMQIRMSTR